MPPVVLLAVGAASTAVAAYAFLRRQLPRHFAKAAVTAEPARADIPTLVRDPDTGIFRPPGA